MATVRRKPRSYPPDRVRDAALAQVEFVRLAAHDLDAARLDAASGLPGWSVRALLAHLAAEVDALPRLLAEPAPQATRPTVTLSQWPARIAGLTADAELSAEAERWRADPAAAIDTAAEQLESVIDTGVREDVLLPHPVGVVRALDFTLTRLVELVVHSDDLTRATGRPVRLDRMAVASTARVLADALAEQVPGAATELRVPPFAAVQVMAGPRHTRGTPSQVVETDPVSWIRLATGRVGWRVMVSTGRLKVSGDRAAGLADHLPVLS